jgi:hypothetical protein
MKEETMQQPPRQRLSHPLRSSTTSQTINSFLTYWPFLSTSSRNRFVLADIPGLACELFPFGQDDRIHLAAGLFSLLFLLDEESRELSVDAGEDFLEYLRSAVVDGWEKAGGMPQVRMLGGLFDELRGHDYLVGGEVVAATWEWLRYGNHLSS